MNSEQFDDDSGCLAKTKLSTMGELHLILRRVESDSQMSGVDLIALVPEDFLLNIGVTRSQLERCAGLNTPKIFWRQPVSNPIKLSVEAAYQFLQKLANSRYQHQEPGNQQKMPNLLEKIENGRKIVTDILDKVGPLDVNNSIQEIAIYSVKRQNIVVASKAGDSTLTKSLDKVIKTQMPQLLNQIYYLSAKNTGTEFGSISQFLVDFERHTMLIKQMRLGSPDDDPELFLIAIGFDKVKEKERFSYPQAIEEMNDCLEKVINAVTA